MNASSGRRRRTRRQFLRALASLPPALASASCSRPPPQLSRDPSTLTIGVVQPRGEAMLSLYASGLQQATLVRQEGNGRFTPALATAWHRTDEGRRWTFALRRGVTFHDGAPLDAEAVSRALRLQLATASPFGLAPGLRDVSAVTVVGPLSVQVDQHTSNGLLLEALCDLPIVGDAPGAALAGPFIEEQSEADRLSLRAFDSYFEGRPRVDRVVYRGFETTRAVWSALLRGDVDLFPNVPPDAMDVLQTLPDLQAVVSVRPATYMIGFNLAHAGLRATPVRQALNFAVDRRALIGNALGGHGLPAVSQVWLQHWAFDGHTRPAADALPYDPRRARELLDAWLPVGPTGLRTTFTCIVAAGFPVFERVAMFVQRSLLDIGINMQLERVQRNDLARRLPVGAFDAFLLDLLALPSASWAYAFWHSGPAAEGRYITSHFSGLDAELDRARSATSDDVLGSAIRDLDGAMRRDPPGLFLCWTHVVQAVRHSFTLDGPARGSALDILSLKPTRL